MIVKFNGPADKMFNRSSLSIGKMSVGAFLGEISLADSEREHMIEVCESISQHLMKQCPTLNPFGLGRHDLVPILDSSDAKGDCIGHLKVTGAYELNFNSPECLSAASVMRAFLPEIPCANAAAIVADEIKKTFGRQEIAFVVGHKSALKHHWYPFLVKDLKEAGLRIEVMSPEEVMSKKPSFIWKWGDTFHPGNVGKSQFDPEFNEWLFEQRDSVVFNAPLSSAEDISNKSWLRSSDDPSMKSFLGENRPLDPHSIWWSVDEMSQKEFMVKPDLGSGGEDAYFSRRYYTTDWIKLLFELYNSGEKYSLWEAKWLPKIKVAGKELAIDINPAFFFNGNKPPKYLYTIIRLDEYWRYEERLQMNVAKGAGIAGIIV